MPSSRSINSGRSRILCSRVIDPSLDLFSQLVFILLPQLVLGFPPQLALDLLKEFFFAFIAGIVEPLLRGFRHSHGRASFQLRSRASSNPTVIVTINPLIVARIRLAVVD